jgi:hypothetical protein
MQAPTTPPHRRVRWAGSGPAARAVLAAGTGAGALARAAARVVGGAAATVRSGRIDVCSPPGGKGCRSPYTLPKNGVENNVMPRASQGVPGRRTAAGARSRRRRRRTGGLGRGRWYHRFSYPPYISYVSLPGMLYTKQTWGRGNDRAAHGQAGQAQPGRGELGAGRGGLSRRPRDAVSCTQAAYYVN